MELTELKPCPFCDSAGELHSALTGDWRLSIRCSECGAKTGWKVDEETAIASWNHRFTDAIMSENERLRALIDSADHEGGSLMWTSDHEKIVARIEMTAQKVHMEIREILDAEKRGPQ